MDNLERCVEEINNPTSLDDVLLPERIARSLDHMFQKRLSGQVILNLNGGQIQSFEVKEHHRL